MFYFIFFFETYKKLKISKKKKRIRKNRVQFEVLFSLNSLRIGCVIRHRVGIHIVDELGLYFGNFARLVEQRHWALHLAPGYWDHAMSRLTVGYHNAQLVLSYAQKVRVGISERDDSRNNDVTTSKWLVYLDLVLFGRSHVFTVHLFRIHNKNSYTV